MVSSPYRSWTFQIWKYTPVIDERRGSKELALRLDVLEDVPQVKVKEKKKKEMDPVVQIALALARPVKRRRRDTKKGRVPRAKVAAKAKAAKVVDDVGPVPGPGDDGLGAAEAGGGVAEDAGGDDPGESAESSDSSDSSSSTSSSSSGSDAQAWHRRFVRTGGYWLCRRPIPPS